MSQIPGCCVVPPPFLQVVVQSDRQFHLTAAVLPPCSLQESTSTIGSAISSCAEEPPQSNPQGGDEDHEDCFDGSVSRDMGCTSSKSDVLTDKGAGANGVSGGSATTSIDISNLPIKTFTMGDPKRVRSGYLSQNWAANPLLAGFLCLFLTI